MAPESKTALIGVCSKERDLPVIELSLTRLKQYLLNRYDQSEILDTLPYLGLDLEGTEGDVVSVEYSPNRPDFSSEAGIARALAGIMDVKVGLPKYNFPDSDFVINVALDEIRKVRPYIFGLYAEILVTEEIIKQLITMQEDLHNGLGRKRSAVAIGIHNAEVISKKILYHGSRDKEYSFVPLGSSGKMSIQDIVSKTAQGIQYGKILSQGVYPLLEDSDGHLLSMPPVINGEHTRLREGISRLFVDVTATEARAGDTVIAIIASMLDDIGATVKTVSIERKEEDGEQERANSLGKSREKTPNMEPHRRAFDLELVNKNLGYDFTLDDAKHYLARSRIELANGQTAMVPRFRADIMHPVDLSEEVALGYGVGRIEQLKVESSLVGSFNKNLRKLDECIEVFVGLGFTEIWNLSLVSQDAASHCHHSFKVENPKSLNYEYLRCDLTSSLLSVLSASTDQEYPQRIFEVAPVFSNMRGTEDKNITGIRENYHGAALLAGADVQLHCCQIIDGCILANCTSSPRVQDHFETFKRGKCLLP